MSARTISGFRAEQLVDSLWNSADVTRSRDYHNPKVWNVDYTTVALTLLTLFLTCFFHLSVVICISCPDNFYSYNDNSNNPCDMFLDPSALLHTKFAFWFLPFFTRIRMKDLCLSA